MADQLTISTALNFDTAAYDQFAYFSLRPELYADQLADVRPTKQSHPGASVQFDIVSDLAVASTSINESTDVSAVTLADATVVVTLNEYGNVAKSTAKLRGESHTPLDPVVANVVAFNAGISVDTIARDVLKGGTNVVYVGLPTARNAITPSDNWNCTSAYSANNGPQMIRKVVAALRGANVAAINGMYVGLIHPDVSYDFRSTTGAANWRDPHVYSDPANIYNGEIGAYESVRWLETPRAPIWADAGSSTTLTDVYGTLILGRQGLAKAWSIVDGNGPQPRVFPTPITDNLRRFLGMAWYVLFGYSIFRQQSVRRIESSSSIGAN